jgi:hypothetical protein
MCILTHCIHTTLLKSTHYAPNDYLGITRTVKQRGWNKDEKEIEFSKQKGAFLEEELETSALVSRVAWNSNRCFIKTSLSVPSERSSAQRLAFPLRVGVF